MTELRKYKIHEDPFDLMPPDGELATLKLHWKTIAGTDDSLQLPQLALLMLDVKPHAADPEKTFSLMGWYHSSRRSQLLSKTTTAMTSIKMHYMELKDRCAVSVSGCTKPFVLLHSLHASSCNVLCIPNLQCILCSHDTAMHCQRFAMLIVMLAFVVHAFKHLQG